MNYFDIDAHPPTEKNMRPGFFQKVSELGVSHICGTFAVKEPPDEKTAALLNKAAKRLSVTEARYLPAFWGFPGLLEKSGTAKMLYVDAGMGQGRDEVLRYAEQSKKPVFLCHETPESTREILEKFPKASVIAGGQGASGFEPLQTVSMLNAFPNFYLNLSAGIWTVNYVLHELIKKMPVRQLLFGSGFPYTNPASRLAAVKWELRDTDVSSCEHVFYQNARALLGEDVL